MAKTNNLHDFVLDIATTIRNIKGTSDMINPQDFSTKIMSIANVFADYINGDITVLNDTDTYLVTTVNSYSFNNSPLTEASFLNVTQIKNSAFKDSKSLTYINFPKVSAIGQAAFGNCPLSQTVVFPFNVRTGTSVSTGLTIGSTAFSIDSTGTTNLEVFDAYITQITGNNNFKGCSKLKTFIIRKPLKRSTVCPLGSTTIFTGTPIADSTTEGFIYVDDSLVDAYKQATNWTTFASKIKGISELPEA